MAGNVVLTDQQKKQVQACLDILERAQNLVNEASTELSAVPGFADEWSALSTPHEVIKEHWYRVDARLRHFLLLEGEQTGEL